jgi:hypothetical protein
MKDPRTWNRREFNVTLTGWFTVLRPTGWFSASRLPGGFRYLIGPSKLTKPEQTAPGNADSHETEIPLQILPPGTHDRHLVRTALVVLTAVAIAWALLCWTANP